MDQLSEGLYEHVLTAGLESVMRLLEDDLRFETSALESDSSAAVVTRHLSSLIMNALSSMPAQDQVSRQVALANKIAELVASETRAAGADYIVPPARMLLSAQSLNEAERGQEPPRRPSFPLSDCALLVNGHGEPSLGAELIREIESAAAVDLLCAFVRWHGVRILLDALAELVARGGRLRILTTTYMGATERRAVDALVEAGADVRITYEVSRTRLHAKAWLLQRPAGLSSAFVGSSNLSRSALHDGLEWNVRLSERVTPSIIEKFNSAFEGYWSSDLFEPYDPASDADRLDDALGRSNATPTLALAGLQVRPYPHQERILEDLEAERTRHGRSRNLVVAATGTGKTVVAALDYKRLRREAGNLKLLFVAHRYEILNQSLSTFRAVLGDGSFGELHVRGSKPGRWQHVFASIQSLNSMNVETLAADHFDMIIVDEFHHAEAKTYAKLLQHFTPRQLLGLTATPERADGINVARWFDNRIASELRLWQALEEGILVPFQYFGISDDTDLSGLKWARGGYDLSSLERVYTGNDVRVAKILASLKAKADLSTMRALGFCVSVAHAEYMATRFTEAGIPSIAVTGSTDNAARDDALRALRDHEVKVLFTVDLFNEGLDVPEVDTVLFLRPTESATVFLQQLGRGLRRADDKTCLTVFDFIGQQHRQFRFDLRYRALTGASQRDIATYVEEGFPYLPAGCHIDLDRVAQQVVLESVRSALSQSMASLAAELREQGDVPLGAFLARADVELDDIYRGGRNYTRLRREAGLLSEAPPQYEAEFSTAVRRMRHVDDPERISSWSRWLKDPTGPAPSDFSTRERRLLEMLRGLLPLEADESEVWLTLLRQTPTAVQEITDLLDFLEDVTRTVTTPVVDADIPLHVHARYTQEEIMTALGAHTVEEPKKIREGVYFDRANAIDVFWVTLVKSETHFSPSTQYRDYAISPRLFHWESQNKTSPDSPVGRRYITHDEIGSRVWIFVREKKLDSLGSPAPYLFVGPAHYRSHVGSKPMGITWELEHALPPELYLTARTAV